MVAIDAPASINTAKNPIIIYDEVVPDLKKSTSFFLAFFKLLSYNYKLCKERRTFYE